MSIFNLSENHHLRKCYLEGDQVPAQSVMKKKMSADLANVYFTFMSPKLKIIVGLEPPLKGGGNAWFVPPEDLLKGKVVVKPLKKECVMELSHYGVDKIGMRLCEIYRNNMKTENNQIMLKHNTYWASNVEIICRQHWAECSVKATTENTKYIVNAYQQFSVLYSSTINKIQDLLLDASVRNIKMIREDALKMKQVRYKYLLKQQVTMLNNKYTKKLIKEQAKLKKLFMRRMDDYGRIFANKLYEINSGKHTAIEEIKKHLEMQNIACQVYVALKEREEHAKEVGSLEFSYKRKMSTMSETINIKAFEIKLTEEKEREWENINLLWKRKVCHVVKHFQMFVTYCLKALPEHADFFINIEKLLLLQLNKALVSPTVDSIIMTDDEPSHTPTLKPHPFYLFCDKSYTPKINEDLCPKHCTSSATEMPVIVINKRCIYAACDNFQQFTDKVKNYVDGRRGEDADFVDYHDYTRNVPIKYTVSQQLQDLKLESSLLQILQQEMANARDVPIECGECKIPHCFDCDRNTSATKRLSLDSEMETNNKQPPLPTPQVESQNFGFTIPSREAEIEYERQPKWASYSRYVKPKKCDCAKMAKKHLLESLPTYMRKTSNYDTPVELNYEKCPIETLKSLVKKASGKQTPPSPQKVPSRTKEIATQYSDHEYDYLCTCLSNESMQYLFKNILAHNKQSESLSLDNQFRVLGNSLSPSYLLKDRESFATDRALSLKHLIERSPQIKEIFEKKHCNSD